MVNEARTLILPRRNEDPDFANGSVFFVGTATVLIRYAGFTILTDPNFLHQGDHVHLGYGLISRRQTNPAIEIEDLPPARLRPALAPAWGPLRPRRGAKTQQSDPDRLHPTRRRLP
jgi:hypothetical protein